MFNVNNAMQQCNITHSVHNVQCIFCLLANESNKLTHCSHLFSLKLESNCYSNQLDNVFLMVHCTLIYIKHKLPVWTTSSDMCLKHQ